MVGEDEVGVRGGRATAGEMETVQNEACRLRAHRSVCCGLPDGSNGFQSNLGSIHLGGSDESRPCCGPDIAEDDAQLSAQEPALTTQPEGACWLE